MVSIDANKFRKYPPDRGPFHTKLFINRCLHQKDCIAAMSDIVGPIGDLRHLIVRWWAIKTGGLYFLGNASHQLIGRDLLEPVRRDCLDVKRSMSFDRSPPRVRGFAEGTLIDRRRSQFTDHICIGWIGAVRWRESESRDAEPTVIPESAYLGLGFFKTDRHGLRMRGLTGEPPPQQPGHADTALKHDNSQPRGRSAALPGLPACWIPGAWR